MRNLIGYSLLLSVLANVDTASAQNAPKPPDNASIMIKAPGPQYRKPVVGEFFAGANWRDIWATPVPVPVLDLATFAGGLKATEEGGNQSRTLRFKGADGRTYIFRSIDKFVHRTLPRDLAHTPLGNVMQDASSALHPTGALAVTPLQAAAGLLQAVPRLVILPNDSRLGEFRDFAGMMGQFEERPDEAEDGVAAFANAAKIASTEKLIEELEQSLDNRIDGRDYLSARLIDFLIGDADRGADQWRWARFDQGDLRTWRPIPRDRDYAFMAAQGVVGRLGRIAIPKLLEYKEEFPKLQALAFMTRDFDRSHLVDLPWPAWESVVTRLQTGISDAVIQSAMNRLPAEQRTNSASIAAGLRARRADLPRVAREYYEMVAHEADVFGSNEDERAEIDRNADGSLDVRLFSEKSGREPRLVRRFDPAETREVRIYLQDGDDHAVVRGSAASSIKLRIAGGDGADVLIDSSRVAGVGDATVFYDVGGKTRFVPGPSTRVSRAAFEIPQGLLDPDSAEQQKQPKMGEERRGVFQDLQNDQNGSFLTKKTSASSTQFWGERASLAPAIGYKEGAGPVVGLGWSHTTYGFRHSPYQSRVQLRALYGVNSGGFGAEGFAEHRFESSHALANLRVRATQFESNRFYGFGNDTPLLDRRLGLVMRDEVSIRPAIGWSPTEKQSVTIGPVLRYVDARPRVGSPAALQLAGGTGSYGQAGIQLDAETDQRELGTNRRGYALRASAAAFPAVWDVPSGYGRAELEGLLYVPLSRPTLALRAGGTRLFGESFPVHDAAFLGGRTSLRGFRWNRFAGDTELHAGAELQLPIGEIALLTRTRLGLIGLADVGRVWFDGDSSGKWHSGAGGGLWLETLGQTVSLTYARGEESRLYLQFGWPF